MKKTKKNKKGFSLAEALITLLIISTVAALSVPFIKKKTDSKVRAVHGVWECRLEKGKHIQTLKNKSGKYITGIKSSDSSCTFRPPPGSKDFYVDICGNMVDNECQNAGDGTHTAMFYPSLNTVKDIIIDKELITFGKYAFAYTNGKGGRILIVY